LRRAVHNEGISRQRLECRGDAALGVEVMRLCEAATQVEDRILHREGFVGANTEFTARNGLLGEEHEAALAKRRYTIDRSEWFASVYGAS